MSHTIILGAMHQAEKHYLSLGPLTVGLISSQLGGRDVGIAACLELFQHQQEGIEPKDTLT
jgi:hypothetical protein